jgi:hypothetical protein
LIPVAASAHGGVEHNTDDAVVTLFQGPLSPIVRDKVKTDFVFSDKNNHRLKNTPVKLTITDIHEDHPEGDRIILTQNLKTDVNGILSFEKRYAKPDFYDIDLDFRVNGKAQEAGFLLQVRNPYKNWFSLTYIGVLAAGMAAGWFAAKRWGNKDT